MHLSVSGQINVKVGYVPAFGSFEAVSSILRDFNDSNSNIIEAPFNELNFMHGINVGLRYKVGALGFEFDWTSLNRDRDVLLYFDQSNSFSNMLYKFGINSFSFGIDAYIGRFGAGASLHSQKLNINREIGSNNLKLVSETNLALDFHLNITLQRSNVVSVIVKPFYRFSLKDYNLNAFSQDLIDLDAFSSDITFYGLSLVFYNGRK